MNARVAGANQIVFTCLDYFVRCKGAHGKRSVDITDRCRYDGVESGKCVQRVTFSLFFCTVAHVR
jgi:hypothetical protein